MSCCPTCRQKVPPSDFLVTLDNKASRNGLIVQLSPQEAEILLMLWSGTPSPVRRLALICGMYGAREEPQDAQGVLQVHISTLRKKLEALGASIETVRGDHHSAAYRLVISDLEVAA